MRAATVFVRLVLVVLATVTPWFYGGVQAGVRVWLMAAVVFALACALVEQWRRTTVLKRSDNAVVPLTMIPLVGALCLGVLHLVPLTESARSTTFRGHEVPH